MAIEQSSPQAQRQSNLTRQIETPGELIPTSVPPPSDVFGMAIALENVGDSPDVEGKQKAIDKK